MVGPLIVETLSGILLEVQPFDADFHRLPARQIEEHFTFAYDRVLVLGDLIAGRQVGIEIIFPVEPRVAIDLCPQAETGADRLLDAIAVDDGQHAGHGRIDKADLGVRLCPKRCGCPGEKLRLRENLGVNFHPDHDFPVALSAPDQFRGSLGGGAHAALHHALGVASNPAARSIERATRNTSCSSNALPIT